MPDEISSRVLRIAPRWVRLWQVIGCVAKMSEQFFIPVLEAMLHQFPFRIQGFHSDNGSEFIKHTVAKR